MCRQNCAGYLTPLRISAGLGWRRRRRWEASRAGRVEPLTPSPGAAGCPRRGGGGDVTPFAGHPPPGAAADGRHTAGM